MAIQEIMIKVEDISKSFESKDATVNALNHVNLEIHKGEIYGVIGMSGAGKSTLVRCLNLLEKPTSGNVYIEGKNLMQLSEKELREVRTHIAMIFQHFNLLMQRTVLDNICFPLEIVGMKKKEAREKAKELLKIVDLEEKAKAYPAQQRVAIARALAMDPKILLCDEATSALDPTTTKSILALLKKINREFGITIVIITHEMTVVQEICSHVAIIDHGDLAETGTVEDVFSHPKTKAAKKLVFQGEDKEYSELSSKRCVRIVFKENPSAEPVIGNMILECKAPVNILQADTKDIGGIAHGQMILQLPDDEIIANRMIAYLQERKLEVEVLEDYVQ